MWPGKVLVNCQMGMSRSSTCVLAYLILRHQMSADEALNTVGAPSSNIYTSYTQTCFCYINPVQLVLSLDSWQT